MNQTDSGQLLRREWAAFLSNRGHKVSNPKGLGWVATSRDSAGKRYRWLLLVAKGKSRSLGAAEREDIHNHVKRAKSSGEEPYVVVRFQAPQPKLILLPAESALRARRISALKGGIPWVA